MEYLKFVKKAESNLGNQSDEFVNLRVAYRKYFAQKLKEGAVAIANKGANLDSERQVVDIVVIHHTSSPPGYDLDYMNAVHLLNIYAPYFANPTVAEERGLKGNAIWSGHFLEGRQTFISYHWIMRMNGSFNRLLSDNEIGWHAGNWDINKRSIGICIDNDYEKLCPTNETLQSLAEHIKTNYSEVSPQKVIGHCEASPKTTCPGTHFIEEWKAKLLECF